MKLRSALVVPGLLAATFALSLSSEAENPRASASEHSYGKLPLSFEANEGQADSSVQFLSHGQGYTLFLRPSDAFLTLAGPAKQKPAVRKAHSDANPSAQPAETSVLHIRLEGANPTASASREGRQITRTNYFLGNDPSRWHTNIANYGRVRYKSVYPGIDLAYYGNQRRLEHDFIVAPHADPTRIRLSLDLDPRGTKSLAASNPRIDSSTGDILLNTPNGEFRMLRPVAYQESERKRTTVPST